MTLADYAKLYGQAKAANDFGVIQCAISNHELFAGMKTKSFTIPEVGLNGIFATQGDISTLSGLCRIAVWYGVNATRPESIGVGLADQA
ncbi:P22 phage major capsid protein family protein [Enterobacter kobei]